jgi:tetratricopeptide (TPR) repeat protein
MAANMKLNNSKVTGPVLAAMLIATLAGCGNAETRKERYFERGEQLLAAHKYEKAGVEFRNALQIDPNFLKARIELGRVAEKLGNVRAALGQYQAVIDAAPKDVEAHVLAGRIYVMGAMPQQALELVQPGLAKDPTNPELLTVRGAARSRLGDNAAGLADAEEAYRRAPDDGYTVALLASLRQNAGQLDSAIDLVQGALGRRPDNSELREVLVGLLLQKQDFPGVETQLKELVRREPEWLEHRYALARFYLTRKQADAAERNLREAVAIAPTSNEPKITLVEELGTQRGAQAAETELSSFIRKDPKNYPLRLLLASYLERDDKIEDAQHAYEAIIADAGRDPARLAASDRLAALRLRAGDAASAARLVADVLHESPRDGEALYVRASLALDRGDATAAIADLRTALRDDPNSRSLQRALARAYVANNERSLAEQTLRDAATADPKDASTRVQLAELLRMEGRTDEAKTLLTQIIQDAPNNTSAHEALYQVQIAQKDFVGARASAQAVVHALPQQGIGSFMLGAVDEADQKVDAAMRDYQAALTVQPDAVEPLAALVRLQVSQGHGEQALATLDDTIAKVPKSAAAYNLKGQTFDALGRSDEAINTFQQTVSLAPNWWVPYQNLSRAQMAAHRTGDAIATLVDGTKHTNDNPTLTSELVALYELTGKSDQAIAKCEDVVARYPTSAAAANNLAMLLVSFRNDSASLERARALSAPLEKSTKPDYQDTVGWVKFKSGDYQQALPLLRSAASEVPDSMLMRYHLAMAELKAGDRDQARKDLTKAVSSGRPFLGRDDARSVLDSLKNAG